MASSAWFSFKKIVEAVKRDYPKSFLNGPLPLQENALDNAMLNWDDQGYLRVVFLCEDEPHYKLFKEGKVHRHIRDGLWYVIRSESPQGDGEVVSQ